MSGVSKPSVNHSYTGASVARAASRWPCPDSRRARRFSHQDQIVGALLFGLDDPMRRQPGTQLGATLVHLALHGARPSSQDRADACVVEEPVLVGVKEHHVGHLDDSDRIAVKRLERDGYRERVAQPQWMAHLLSHAEAFERKRV